MAYSLKGLSIVATAGVAGLAGVEETKRILAYHTNDDAATVQTAAYFPVTALLRKGDVIMAAMDVDITPVLKIYVVTVAPVGVAPTIALQTTT
jgi:hypothetical protein